MKQIKIGHITIEIDTIKKLSKDDFVRIYKGKLICEPELLWEKVNGSTFKKAGRPKKAK